MGGPRRGLRGAVTWHGQVRPSACGEPVSDLAPRQQNRCRSNRYGYRLLHSAGSGKVRPPGQAHRYACFGTATTPLRDASTAFSRRLDLPGEWVRSVRFEPDRVVVRVVMRRRRLNCPSARTPPGTGRTVSITTRSGISISECGGLEVHVRLRRLALPGARPARGGRPIHKRLRERGCAVGDEDRQDGDLSADTGQIGPRKCGDADDRFRRSRVAELTSAKATKLRPGDGWC